MRYVGGVLTAKQNAEDLSKILAHYGSDDTSFLVWAIERATDKAFVGTCALIINDKEEHEIGYRLSEAFWGHGYGLEVTEALIDHAFHTLRLQDLVAYVDKANEPSVHILNKSSFNFDSEYYNEELKCTDRRYTLSRREWQALKDNAVS